MKRTLLVVLTALMMVLMATAVFAQDEVSQEEIDSKMQRAQDLREQMGNAETPEEYEELKAQYEALGKEIEALVKARNADKKAKQEAINKFNEGNNALRSRNAARAIAAYEEATSLNPMLTPAFYQLGVAYRMQRNLPAAAEAFNRAIQLNPDYVKAYYAKGLAEMAMRQLDDAVKTLRTGVAVKDGDPEDLSKAFTALGLAYYRQKKYEQSISAFNQATKLDATNDDAFYNLGKAYAEQEQWRASADAIRKAVELEPSEARYLAALAEKYNRLGEYSEAASNAQAATSLNKNFAAAWFELGWALENMGKEQDAINAYQKAMNDRSYRSPAEYQIKSIRGEF